MEKIKGYEQLSPEQIDLINQIKTNEARMNAVIDDLQVTRGSDKRLLAIAATHFETGYMFLTKAIAAPERLVETVEGDV